MKYIKHIETIDIEKLNLDVTFDINENKYYSEYFGEITYPLFTQIIKNKISRVYLKEISIINIKKLIVRMKKEKLL